MSLKGVDEFLRASKVGTLLVSPFGTFPPSGAGTTALTAMSLGVQGTGIEILPLGNANRYDYTRTYALELVYLDHDAPARAMADANQHDAQTRALILSKAIMRRDDVRVRKLIEDFAGVLDYQGYGLEELAISTEAWACVQRLGVDPRIVFAHPDLLLQHPEASLHYRGVS